MVKADTAGKINEKMQNRPSIAGGKYGRTPSGCRILEILGGSYVIFIYHEIWLEGKIFSS